MKRYIKSSNQTDKPDIDIVVNYVLVSKNDQIAASSIKPFTDEDGYIIDPLAYQEFVGFLENLNIILDYYDMDIHKQDKKPVPINKHDLRPKFRSEYWWTAPVAWIEANNVPEYLLMRITDHPQEFSPKNKKRVASQQRNTANSIKRPATKKKQKYQFLNVVANGEIFESYLDAQKYVEKEVRKWLESHNIDLTRREQEAPTSNTKY